MPLTTTQITIKGTISSGSWTVKKRKGTTIWNHRPSCTGIPCSIDLHCAYMLHFSTKTLPQQKDDLLYYSDLEPNSHFWDLYLLPGKPQVACVNGHQQMHTLWWFPKIKILGNFCCWPVTGITFGLCWGDWTESEDTNRAGVDLGQTTTERSCSEASPSVQ